MSPFLFWNIIKFTNGVLTSFFSILSSPFSVHFLLWHTLFQAGHVSSVQQLCVAGGYHIGPYNITVLENPKVAHSVVIDWLVINVIIMARNSRENGPTDIDTNFGPQTEELVSLGKNMYSEETCYLEHGLAQRQFPLCWLVKLRRRGFWVL